MNKLRKGSAPKLKVATSVVRKEEGEGPLFYILPPLLVIAVFVFCALAGDPTSAQGEEASPPAAAAGEADAGVDATAPQESPAGEEGASAEPGE